MRNYRLSLAVMGGVAAMISGCGGGGVGETSLPITSPVESPGPDATPAPISNQTRSYNVAVSGSRGSIALSVAGAPSTVTPGGLRSVTTLMRGSGLLAAPSAYGDRAFVAWQYKGANFSTDPNLSALPTSLQEGDTITAIYGPTGARSTALTPNYNQTESFYWPISNLPLKVFFASSITDEYKTAIVEGLDRWASTLGGTIAYSLVATEAEATVVVKTGDAGGFNARTTVTSSTAISPRPIVKATVTFDATKFFSFTPVANRDAFVALASHEFGHVLGIQGGSTQGHSADQKDIMYPTVSAANTVITTRDINTLMNLYSGLFSGRHQAATTRAVETSQTRHESVACEAHLKL